MFLKRIRVYGYGETEKFECEITERIVMFNEANKDVYDAIYLALNKDILTEEERNYLVGKCKDNTRIILTFEDEEYDDYLYETELTTTSGKPKEDIYFCGIKLPEDSKIQESFRNYIYPDYLRKIAFFAENGDYLNKIKQYNAKLTKENEEYYPSQSGESIDNKRRREITEDIAESIIATGAIDIYKDGELYASEWLDGESLSSRMVVWKEGGEIGDAEKRLFNLYYYITLAAMYESENIMMEKGGGYPLFFCDLFGNTDEENAEAVAERLNIFGFQTLLFERGDYNLPLDKPIDMVYNECVDYEKYLIPIEEEELPF